VRAGLFQWEKGVTKQTTRIAVVGSRGRCAGGVLCLSLDLLPALLLAMRARRAGKRRRRRKTCGAAEVFVVRQLVNEGIPVFDS